MRCSAVIVHRPRCRPLGLFDKFLYTLPAIIFRAVIGNYLRSHQIIINRNTRGGLRAVEVGLSQRLEPAKKGRIRDDLLLLLRQ